jgi:hypothetical protein
MLAIDFACEKLSKREEVEERKWKRRYGEVRVWRNLFVWLVNRRCSSSVFRGLKKERGCG